MVFRNMTDYINRSFEHYKRLGVGFDAVYSGFLASSSQIDGCLEFFRGFPDALKIVDPVMGDNGSPYKTYTPELCSRMSELVRIADIITPNLTEAAILLGEDYSPSMSRKHAANWLERLSELAPTVVITGIIMSGEYCNVAFNRDVGELIRVKYRRIPADYPGTGDIFASVLTGALLRGDDLHSGLGRATRFVTSAVAATHAAGGEARNGVMFEGLLRKLC
jgi:pyridoxine kinase